MWKTLEIDNSIIKTINTNPLKVGESGIIAQLVLRTDEDHSHNYYLDSIDLIAFIGINYKDIYSNPIEVELPSDSFGLLYDITIGGEDPETKNVKFEKGDDCYYIREYQTKSGDHKLTIRIIYSLDKNEFEYYKRL